ncbi:hypothetical protein NEUTE1DRAFT_120227 [Neurospora tetrasperma FGSC 2508]|uniref:MARVEL domain-containing protein n=1 Tax=Neurospora tetrasperma (strain FGSC 2508 / ATCC MYA-4615 / P0657) TaxID=510951 RepID=F8MBY4_NEUT8|nr:uncharacterized protein NEUTE1DRAFT_120227 [Neurospora tetrasperma FGSC 2508]EGO61193.1 hypothetical protein NEUTE1DRAFT_120227 [Neurospora tetrasperma FGSC 2508]EGZ74801.1 hypothetical protein NEUTE2DRAFT_103857 [Neurospora tetrasperma FGSC 2509]
MGAKTGLFLRGLQGILRGIQFGCAATVLALTSYFLATMANHGLDIDVHLRAVEGISGGITAYTLITILLLCCIPGQPFFSFIMMVVDVCCAGALIYVAIRNKNGASTCDGIVDTPYGKGNADTNVVDNGHGGFTVLPSLHHACKMETACLAVSIIGCVVFILSPFMELVLVRHRKKEKRYGPSPANDYTSGSGRKPGFFASLRGKGSGHPDADLMNNKLPEHTSPSDVRDSYTTEQTRVGGVAPGNTGAYGSYNPYNETSVGQQQHSTTAYSPPHAGNNYNKYDMSFGQQQQDIAMGQYPNKGDHVYDRR